MPNLGRGTESLKILLSQASKDMYDPLVPMFFPILGAHVSGSEFQYPDLTWKELCGMMANLVADSGCNKGQLSLFVEEICRDFRVHDETEYKKLVDGQRQIKTHEANKEKPARPRVGADSRVCPNICGLYSENTRNAGKHENLPWSACGLKINRKSLRKSTTVCLNDFESICE